MFGCLGNVYVLWFLRLLSEKRIGGGGAVILSFNEVHSQTVSHPHGRWYPGQKSGHSGVDARFLGHGTACSPAHHPEQTIPTRLRQAVVRHKRAAAVSLKPQIMIIAVHMYIINYIFWASMSRNSSGWECNNQTNKKQLEAHKHSDYRWKMCIRWISKDTIIYQTSAVITLITHTHEQNTLTETHPDLAGISAPFLIAGAEHTGGDLVVIVIGSVTDGVTYDGDVRFQENISLMTWEMSEQFKQ